ncbi:winged helix-turn-helix domain-containing protein, partial [Latilactobacillus sakei subsp. carnosus]
MIPNYQQFMRPFLEVAYQAKQQGKEEVRLRDVIDVLAEQFELSEEERSELLPSGRQRVIDNRIGWARTYLTKAGLLEATRRAHFSITDQGIQAVKSKETIDNAYLNQFEKFIAFKLQSNNDSEKLPLQPPLQTESL